MKLVYACLIFSIALLNAENACAPDYEEMYEKGEIDPDQAYQTGPCTCFCPITRFAPEYYCEPKCILEPYQVNVRCCRYVDETYTKKNRRMVTKAYEKKCCRMVPEYYIQTYCKEVPEYYYQTCTDSCGNTYQKKCCRMVSQQCEKKCCRMVREYYNKTCTQEVPEYFDEVCTRKVPEYYNTTVTRYRNKCVMEQKCRYRPYTSLEKKTVDPSVAEAEPQNLNYIEPSGEVFQIEKTAAQADKIIALSILGKIASQKILDNKEQINVAVEGGNVYLTGFVRSEAQKARVEYFVRLVQGVGTVDNQIDIVKAAPY